MPVWLTVLAWISVGSAIVSALWIAVDLLLGNQQHMWIMNLVWPLTGLWAGPLALAAYYRVGRLSSQKAMHRAKERGEDPPGKRKPFWQSAALGTLHCGSGCTLGDILAEWLLFFFPVITIFGATIRFELFGHKLFATWVLDFVLAFLIGIAFQYFTIKPMRDVSPGEALVDAVKADTLSLTAWQVGMYGWMAIAVFAIFGHELDKLDPVFWFMMQIAMLAGFFTAYPVNWWLLTRGIKERM
jgi:hypothetical protein